MNYDQEIQDIVANIKSDKSIVQPWRNKAMARLEEAQAFIRMGKTTSLEKPDDPPGANRFPIPNHVSELNNPNRCTCAPLEIDPTCPIHGNYTPL